jgi:hypothetical protein
MFLRKVDRSFPDAVLTDIMSIDFGHVYLLLHNQYKVKRDNQSLIVAEENNTTLISQFLQLREQSKFGHNLLLIVAAIIVFFINFV